MSDLIVPSTISTKADFDQWVDKELGNKLTTTQRDALKTDIAAKLGLDMGNAITAYGLKAIKDDIQYFFNNPNATSLPKLDPNLRVGDPNGATQFDALRAKANQFSDPFLIDLTSVLALMHETSEKLRSATKELREAENQTAQAKMQASAEQILAAGQFQMIAGALGASMQIAGGAAGIAGAAGSLGQLGKLNVEVKQFDQNKAKFDSFDVKQNQFDKKVGQQELNQSQLDKIKSNTDRTDWSAHHGLNKAQAKLDANQVDLAKSKTSLDQQRLDLGVRPDSAMFQMKVQNRSTEIQNKTAIWQSSGTILDGFGKAMTATFNGIGSHHEAAKAIHDKEAQQAQFEKDTTNDLVRTLGEFSQQLRQTIASIISSQDQAAHRVANV